MTAIVRCSAAARRIGRASCQSEFDALQGGTGIFQENLILPKFKMPKRVSLETYQLKTSDYFVPFARGVLIPNFQEPKRVFSATFQPKLVRFFSKGSDLDVFVPEGGAVNLA